MRITKKQYKYASSVSYFNDPIHSFFIHYPTPYNLSYFWNFGSLSFLFLLIQILTGFFLSMHYTPDINFAFLSIDHIMRDVQYGWVIRYLHSNGASMFLLVLYIHIFRGIYYGSYRTPRKFLWFTGVLIYLLVMGAAFIGYVLPWGQMSYWGATVITNFVTVIPFFGQDLLYWIWGGFSINNATLNRFFSVHYLLPFIVLALAGLHVIVLHDSGSSNPSGFKSKSLDKVSFYPYFIAKDLFGFILFLIFYFTFVFFFPELLGHSDNYIEANPLVTPSHIVPEWYFLPFYGILRSIPHKTYGILIMLVSILIVLLLPILDFQDAIRSTIFRGVYKKFFWIFLFNLVFLGFLGAQTPTYPFIELGLICTHFHLIFFLVIIPSLNLILYWLTRTSRV
jgi:ubiquinol-cytochrome c reductase cytochrome b subunit